jgi:hypothetical protein
VKAMTPLDKGLKDTGALLRPEWLHPAAASPR